MRFRQAQASNLRALKADGEHNVARAKDTASNEAGKFESQSCAWFVLQMRSNASHNGFVSILLVFSRDFKMLDPSHQKSYSISPSRWDQHMPKKMDYFVGPISEHRKIL